VVAQSTEGKSDRLISELLYTHEDSVRNIRKRFVEDGLQAALEDKARPKRETKPGRLSGQQGGQIVYNLSWRRVEVRQQGV
jgi:transposase